MSAPKSLLERLLSRSKRLDNGCLIFVGSWGSGGYGLIYHERTIIKAHRAMWMCHHGEIPEGTKILHKCDNPPCIDIEHLFSGTQDDNVQDMITKGRSNFSKNGSKNGRAILSEDQAKEILLLLKEDRLTHQEIADQYGIARRTVGYLKDKGWKKLKESANVSA